MRKIQNRHIFVSVLAYHLLYAIEYSLRSKQDTRSWHTIKLTIKKTPAVNNT